MAWTLAEMSKIETDVLRKSIIDTLLWEANLMEIVPWETIGQLSTSVVMLDALPSVGFRMINAGYGESTGTFKQKTENISLMGNNIDTDKAIARAKNTIADARSLQQDLTIRSMAYNFNDKFINGNPVTEPKEFKGIKERINDLYAEGFTSQYIDNAGTSGDGILHDSTERQNFLDKLDLLIHSIKGHKCDALLMNSTCMLAVRSLLRREQLLNTAADMFGRITDVYQGVRMIDIGVKSDQVTEIITNDETLESAGAAESTSIYAVKFGEGDMLWGIQEYPMEAEDKGILESLPVYRTEVDWPLGLAHVDPRCMARLYGIIPNASD